MKKFLLLAALAVLGFTVNAQDIHFGAKAGLNLATLTGDVEGADSRTSFHVGAVAEIEISDQFSVQPELLYSAQGAKGEESYSEFGYSEKYESTLKLDYLSIPIMAKYYVADGFSIEAGPQVGFLLSAKEEYDYSYSFDGETGSESGEEDVKDSLKGIDFGLNFGLGYKMENGLNFAARYNLGLANINDDDDSDGYEIKNGVFQISVGYFFN